MEPMTKEEMKRFLDREIKNGSTELEAYRSLMEILGIELSRESREKLKESE